MKTAVSLPDDVFERATRYAKKLGMSRSELVALALSRYLDEQQARDVKASYDDAFGPESGADETRALRRAAARRSLGDVEW
jgi:hypothetical protein